MRKLHNEASSSGNDGSSPVTELSLSLQDRRKKCNEAFPLCGECRRLGLVCNPRTDNHQRSDSTVQESGLMNDTGTIRVQNPSEDSCVKPLSGSHSSSYQSCTKEYLEWIAQLDESDDVSGFRQRQLNDSNALASWKKANGSPAPVHPDTSLANFPGVDQEAVAQWHPKERHLLNHFVQFVSRPLVVVYDDSNPFLTEILPMAFESLPVRHALLALAARHLCRVYPVFEEMLVNQQALALHYVKAELQAPITSQCLLAAILLMCLFEVIDVLLACFSFPLIVLGLDLPRELPQMDSPSLRSKSSHRLC